METTSFRHSRTQSINPSLPINKVRQQLPKPQDFRLMPSARRSLQSHGLSLKRRFGHAAAVGCVASDSGLLAELEMKPEEEEEWRRIGRLGGKCKERKGMVELLECLETEAIMGEDQGKEPTDYNRRAQIFDKSSRVFQALKEARNTAHQSSQQQP
ncbi:hypothetical protein CCACVL1_20995 [Corchorus capsularis]|uniref:Uncharacterized protein n=1 Tax=Corchorus capsularis TaxID=210143 RepID=A0A1R3H8S1_COCAP|nr:hypothetical protein CCACVL1_20995 [Corchorus capsularis]